MLATLSDSQALHLLASEDGPPVVPRRAYIGTADEVAATLGLARKTFFTWRKHGDLNADPLPFEDPSLVPAWYERMRTKGVFKHRIPDNVLATCGPAKAPATPAPPPSSSSAPGETSGTFGQRMQQAPTTQGIGAEIQALERRVASLREASDAAYAAGDDLNGDQLRQKHQVELEKLRKLKKDAPRLLADDEEFTRKAWVAEDLASVIPPMIETWIQEGSRFHRDSQSSLPRGEFMRLWRATVTNVCRAMAKSRFAPPLMLEA